jgi:hypothetical protein
MDTVEIVLLVQKLKPLHVPGDVAGVGHDLKVRHRSDKPLLLLLEISCVAKWQAGARFPELIQSKFRGCFPLGMKMPSQRNGRFLSVHGTVLQRQAPADRKRCPHRGK